MIESLDLILPMMLGFAATLYVWLAVRVLRVEPQAGSHSISYFLFLNAAIVAGAAFSSATPDPQLFGMGRVLTFFGGGFVPVVFYMIYREYTVGRPQNLLLVLLCILPAGMTLLAITNPLHHLLWTVEGSGSGTRFGAGLEPALFNRVFVPFAYGLFGYACVALAGSVRTIARAHRRNVLLLLLCAALPYIVSLADRIFSFGPPGIPVTSVSVALMVPFYWWATQSLRVHEFTPLAYRTMFDHVRDPIIVLDRSRRIVSANRQAVRLLKATESELMGTQLWKDIPEVQALLEEDSRGHEMTRTVRLLHNRFFEVSGTAMTGPSGQDQGTVIVCRDVTERKEALRALADSEHLIRSLIEHSSNGILRFARDHSEAEPKFRCIFANGAAERFLDNGTLVGMPVEKIALLEPQKLLERFDGPTPGSAISYESALERAEGEAWLRIVGEPIGHDFSVTLIDITQRKQNENKILADSLRDPLTGVLNRRGFEAEATEKIAACSTGAVLYLDLNHFKAINDRFGHPAGDALLKAFGHRLEFCLRPEDVLARLGGDEFAIVLPGVSVDDARHVAERLVSTACEPYIIQGQEIACAASVGIALMPRHGSDLWRLVSVADQAMYNTKSLDPAESADNRSIYVDAAIAS